MLDRLRALFALLLAVALPLVGLLLAGLRLADGDRDEALRIAAATALGVALYALFVF